MSNRSEIEGINWSADRILPAFQAPQQLTVFDLRGASPEVQLSAATMAGLINRPQPKVYLITSDEEVSWLKEAAGSIAQETSAANGDGVIEGLMIAFRSAIQGMIIYNPDFTDSINIATTMAGQRNGIVVSPTQAQDLQQAYKLPILADLRTYHWNNRLQAYDWARQNLLPNSSSHAVAGLDPNIAGGLRSFLVATNTFVYYLDSRNFLPDITNNFQSERGLMQAIFKEYSPGAVHLGWFIDEGSGVSLTSDAAIVVLASDFFYNLEVWTSLQPATAIARKAPMAQSSTQGAIHRAPPANQIAISFTISDGDNLQYIQHRMRRLWGDRARGSFPLGWTISPVLIQAAPAMAEYYYSTASFNDEFVAGPCGAGYMFPSRWPAQELAGFLERTGQLMQSLQLTALEVLDTDWLQSTGIPFIGNLRQTGMVVSDTNLQQRFIQALLPYGLRGFLNGAGIKTPEQVVVQGVPVYKNLGLADSINKTLELVRNATSSIQQRPLYLNVYIMAWSMTPSDVKQVLQQLGSQFTVVRPGTLLEMIAK
ncbi:MAG TPA: GxGYxYP domain-containing protein, partial [Ktedonobacteraceae bacterium]